MVGFEKALGAVKVIKDQIQYRSQSLLNLARGATLDNVSVVQQSAYVTQEVFVANSGTLILMYK